MFKREIKSFVRRQRRLTDRQLQAMQSAFPQYGVIISDAPLDLPKIFGNHAPVICEIGFGLGDALLSMAKNNPENNYLGIEVHEPGVAAVMLGIIDHHLKNIRVIQYDAVKVFHNIPDNTLSRIHLYFPDPWPKKKHHKRRIVQSAFIYLLCDKLIDGGVLHFATDWQQYAERMMHVLSENVRLKNCISENQFADNKTLSLRVNTKFEKRGVKLGHGVWDLLFKKHIPTTP
ncbi:MAG: tRNA (guanine-N(7)-)-methyltransferase [uncultured bacterium]|nr:MAG: tRNA (guanine-N(7)-)-methyltransferase [uncultured bacterium]OGT33625.1 MAG: tRNA (guanosine(46)-N7)-methyltransferase TrmB [Gammaproteobacteria bacterium RIFCSPHIGHO2_02_FULL_39_13]OGT49639.1 MAG: tRNA (guanosine(46)-N7)-methyltransferase TrmB [Gammaproteobacteria bacterium RIFCSPHIGHO2_12_FULL_39_24]